jgi:ankyrin repeat protein
MQGELEVETTVQQQRHLLLSQIKDGTLSLQAFKDSVDREIIQIHDTVDESKQTLLHLAASFSPISSTPAGVGVTAGIGLGAGLTSANASILSFLLESKVNLNAKDERNWTPLHVACNASNLSAISLLLQASADVSAVNNEGRWKSILLVKQDSIISFFLTLCYFSKAYFLFII